MRPIVVLLIVIALGVAGLTAVLANRLVANHTAPAQAAGPVAGPADEVLVAAVDIKPGVILKAEDIRYETWPTTALNPRFIRRQSADDPKAAYVGTVARRPVMAGEPLTAEAVFRQDEGGVLAGLLSPGMRAVAIPVAATTAAAGFVLPGDHVDIVLNQDLRAAISATNGGQARQGGPTAGVARFSAETVLNDVRVLAVDDKLAKPDTASNITGKTVTVEVTPKDAEVLATALRMGDLSLTLRSLALGEGGDVEHGFTSDLDVSQALRAALGTGAAAAAETMPRLHAAASAEVRVNRGGANSTQRFAN